MDPLLCLAQGIVFKELEVSAIVRKPKYYRIFVQKKIRGEVCPSCAVFSNSIYDHRMIELKDEPIRGKQVFLKVLKKRYYCKPCQRVFSEPIPGVLPRRRTTQRYRRGILWACENFQSLKKVRTQFRCSASFIYSALYEQLELRRRTRIYPWPEIIGIDEISFCRNKKFGFTEYATVVVDMKNRRVIEVVLGKNKKTLLAELAHLEGRDRVKCVVMDMCDPFRNFVREFFPNAQIVADKFHALRLPTPHILRVLKEEIPAWADRRQMRRFLLRRPQNLDYFERSKLYKFLEQYPRLNAIYTAKERLFSLYEIRYSAQAPGSYQKLLNEFKGSPFEEVQRFGRTFKKWENEVLGYFIFRRTNGIVEGFNNKIKLVKKMGYGYRSFKNFRLRVLNACAG